MRLDKCLYFCRAKVTALGSLDTGEEDQQFLGAIIIPWTDAVISDDVFAEEEVRGVLTSEGELLWLWGDSEVEVIEPPRCAGDPDELIGLAQPIGGGLRADSPDGWHPFIWRSPRLFNCVVGLTDADTSVEFILAALTFAPDVDDLRPQLLAALKARYAALKRQAHAGTPAKYSWRRKLDGRNSYLMP
ncbi:MAG: hypothetical protein O3A42_19950 [Actinobacteria bacterium]|nr:hypothetical protein [Actinomycetota bacterium]